MTTVHLIYPTLTHILSSLTDKYSNKPQYVIKLVYRKKIIKQTLEEYCSLPSVLNDIIHSYTGSIKKIDCIALFIDHSLYDGDDVHMACRISFKLVLYSNNIDICVNYYEDKITFTVYFEDCRNIIQSYDAFHIDHVILRLNTFMDEIYKKKDYINCPVELDSDCICFMKQNSIICMREKKRIELSGVLVKNYSEFTHLIVKLKCIIDGIQRYFKTVNAKKYCEKKIDVFEKLLSI